MKGKSLDICPETNKGQLGLKTGIFPDFKQHRPKRVCIETPESSEHEFPLWGNELNDAIYRVFASSAVPENHITSPLPANRWRRSHVWLADLLPFKAPSMHSQSIEQAPMPTDSDLQLYVEADLAELAISADSLPKPLVDAFAAATGWELARVGDEIKIVDMNPAWPAQTPTAHRGMCDRVAEELSKLI